MQTIIVYLLPLPCMINVQSYWLHKDLVFACLGLRVLSAASKSFMEGLAAYITLLYLDSHQFCLLQSLN